MALDARSRSSIYGKFARILGPDDANAVMSEKFRQQAILFGSGLAAAVTVLATLEALL